MTTDLHIPQQVPYRMVGVLVDCDEQGATTEYWVGAVTPYMLDGKLTPAGVLENMVQSCYAWWGELARRKGEEYYEQPTRMSSVSNFVLHREPLFGEDLYTKVVLNDSRDDKIHLRIRVCVKKEIVAEAEMILAKDNYRISKSVVIVGGGVSGLFTAALLAKRGVKVTVLEQNSQPGGGLLSFYKNGRWWDTGIHCIMGFQSGSWCWNLFRELNIHVDIKQVDSIVIYGERDENDQYQPREFLYPSFGNARLHYYRQLSFVFGDQVLFGGTRPLLHQLVAYINTHGGDIVCNANVNRVLFKNQGKEVIGVSTDRGEKYEADVVISSIHAKQLVELCNYPVFKKSTLERLHDTKESPGSVSLYVKFVPNSVPCGQALRYIVPENIALYFTCDAQNQEWCDTLTIYQWVDYEELKPWHEQRDEKYDEWKEIRARKILNRVYECMPELKDCVESYFVATSLTFRDEFHSPEGSLYGMADELQTVYTKVPNLILTGQSCYPHGFANMLAISIRTRDAVLEYLDKQK